MSSSNVDKAMPLLNAGLRRFDHAAKFIERLPRKDEHLHKLKVVKHLITELKKEMRLDEIAANGNEDK